MANCDRGNRLRGTGTALFLYGIGNTGQANPAVVELRHVAGSRFLLLTSTVDMGQGSHQALRRLCARLLDVPVDDIAISSGPTSAVPDSGKTSASRTTHFVGEAVRDACDHLIVSALAAARDVLSWQRATWHRGRVRSEPGDGHTAKEATLDQLSELRASGSFTAVGRYAPDLSAAVARYYPVYAVGIVVASITLDAETGYIGVDQVFAAHDVGELLDEDRADGQVVGGVAMGLSLALIDQAVPGPAILAAPDVPPVEVRFVAEPVSGQLVKGLGEPSVLGVGAAVHAAYRSIIERNPAAAKWRPHPVQRWLRSQPTDDTWTGDRENSTCTRDRNPCV